MDNTWSISVDKNNNRAFLPSNLWGHGGALLILPDFISVLFSAFMVPWLGVGSEVVLWATFIMGNLCGLCDEPVPANLCGVY